MLLRMRCIARCFLEVEAYLDKPGARWVELNECLSNKFKKPGISVLSLDVASADSSCLRKVSRLPFSLVTYHDLWHQLPPVPRRQEACELFA